MEFPFSGVVERRPYPPTGLTTERWRREVPIELVELRHLTLTQRHLYVDALLGYEGVPDGDAYPHVVSFDGKLYLEDGHTRVVREVLIRRTNALFMRVFRGGGYRPNDRPLAPTPSGRRPYCL